MSASEGTFFITGGTLRDDAPCYVERQADKDLLHGLLHGEFCYVLTSRQMGKSSLMVRTAGKLREQGAHVIALDLTAIGQNLTPDQWYDGLVMSMGRQLRLEDEFDDFWQAHSRLSPVQRLMNAIREVGLVNRAGRLVVFVDEIDVVRSLPFSTDEYFAAIRECYNRRTQDAELNRLTFCLLGVAAPAELIRESQMTPFNIGRRIQLNDFTTAEAACLTKGLGKNEPAAKVLLERILHWTGGHPYLTQRLCKAVTETADVVRPAQVDRLCEELFLSHRARERDDNLLFVRERILRSHADPGAVLKLYQQVREGRKVRDDETNALMDVLRLSGITRVADGCLQVRNRIYHRVFDSEWVQANLPMSTGNQTLPDSAATKTVFFLQSRRTRRWAIAATLGLLASVSGLFYSFHERPGKHATATGPASVAVLPFVNMSGDKDNEYLSDGITEDLCTALAQVRGLRVPARTSCFVFKGKTGDIRNIGRELNVATVLEGSVSKSGNRLRINAQLISVADGFHLWATNYDREMSDLLALRSEIAKQVVAALRVQLLPGEKRRLEKQGTENPEAHRLYLLGRSFWNQRTGDGLKKALDYFEQALGKDPKYALAHAGLADCYIVLPEYANVPTKEAISKAHAAALTALKLDDTLGEAHAALACVRGSEWDCPGAEAEFRQAIELSPNYATAHHWYSLLLRNQGRFDEASREILRAQELDPLSPVINVNVGLVLYLQGHYDQAIAVYRTVVELNPKFPGAHKGLGDAYLMKQRHSEAIMEFQTIRASVGNIPYGLGLLGLAYGVSGKVNEARKVLDELTAFLQQGYEVQYDIALVYHGLGDREKTLDWLAKALDAQTQLMANLKVDPLWQNLRSEPRFVALLKKMGLDK